MTIDQFRDRLKALLNEAAQAGLDIDDICAIAEHVIENAEWTE